MAICRRWTSLYFSTLFSQFFLFYKYFHKLDDQSVVICILSNIWIKKKKVGEWLMLYWSSKQELECLTEHLISVIFLEKIPHTHCTRVLTLLACSHGHTKNQSLPLVGWISLNMLNHNYALYVRLECGIFSMFDSTVIKQIYPYDFCDTSNVAAKVLNLYHAWM